MNETVVRGANVLIDRANCSASAGVPPARLEACLMALPPDAIIDAEPLNIAPWWDPWGGAGVPMDFCDLPSYEEANQPPACQGCDSSCGEGLLGGVVEGVIARVKDGSDRPTVDVKYNSLRCSICYGVPRRVSAMRGSCVWRGRGYHTSVM